MKDLSSLRLADLWREVKVTEEDIWGDLKLETKMYLKKIIEGCLIEEQDIILKAPRHARYKARVDYRNGYYFRSLETTLGTIGYLKVPRNRLTKLESKIFKKYKRKHVDLTKLIKDCFLAGISTRRIGEVLEDVIGHRVSAATVSNIAKTLDSYVRAFHIRPIEDKYRYIFFDGINLRVKSLESKNKRTVLVAYGVTWDGIRELISFKIANNESEESWYMFVDNLYRRGLKGDFLNLVTIDGNRALALAVNTVYPYVDIQGWWVHKLRNIASKLPKRAYDSCLFDAKKIYMAGSKKSAVAIYKNWVARYSDIYPKAVECLSKDIESMLCFFDYPKDVWKKIRTTNAIERSLREVRRRTRPMSCFENDKSCSRIIYGVISHLNKVWKDKPVKEFTQKA